jgi:hypothetical protein
MAPAGSRSPCRGFGLDPRLLDPAGSTLSSVASAVLSRRVGNVVGYPPLCDMSELQHREFREALLDAGTFEGLPGKWQAAILKAHRPGRSFGSPAVTELGR